MIRVVMVCDNCAKRSDSLASPFAEGAGRAARAVAIQRDGWTYTQPDGEGDRDLCPQCSPEVTE